MISSYDQQFRECKDSLFCVRNRFADEQKWTVEISESKISDSTFSVPIFDSKYHNRLLFELSFISTGAIHYKISPFDSEPFNRYDCSSDDSIVSQSVAGDKLDIFEEKDENEVKVKTTCNKGFVLIKSEPFLMTVFDENEMPKLTVNPDSKGVFETNIDREEFPEHYELVNFSNYEESMKNGPESVAMTFQFYKTENRKLRFVGVPSHSLSSSLPSTVRDGVGVTDPLRLFNVDRKIKANSVISMYGAIPYLVGHSGSVSTSVFWCNPSETWIDIDNKQSRARFISESGFIDCFIFYGAHSDVVKAYTNITGRPTLPQLFSLGYHQSRWSYMNSKEVRTVQNHLDKKNIPHDSIWLDIDHTDDKKYFTFDPKAFKDSKALAHELEKNKRYLITVVDPHLKVERDYQVYYEAKDGGYFIKGKNNRDFIANCWPGRSGFVDFFNPDASEWWSNNYNFGIHRGAAPNVFIWNDMNEPAVFDQPDNTCPRDCIHYGGYEDRDVHNINGHKMIMSTYQGLINRDENHNERPFILTRSFFAGTQKYAFMWTGDNTADWEDVRNSLSMTLTLGISGFPFSGSDVGGFFGSPDNNLLLKWFQLGAYCYPFFRCHCHHKSDHREPYGLKSEYLAGVTTAIQERYQLLPLWYTAAYQASLTGEPIVRPLWYDFDYFENDYDDEDGFSTEEIQNQLNQLDSQVMISDALLVIPYLSEELKEVAAYFPPGRWYEYRSLQEVSFMESNRRLTIPYDRDLVPLYIHGGKIVFTKPKVRKSSMMMIQDPFNMIIALDEDGKASGELYVDDGHTFNYKSNQAKIYRRFEFNGTTLSSVQIEPSNYDSDFINEYEAQIDLIQIAGIKTAPKNVKTQFGIDVETALDGDTLQLFVNLNVKEDWTITFEF